MSHICDIYVKYMTHTCDIYLKYMTHVCYIYVKCRYLEPICSYLHICHIYVDICDIYVVRSTFKTIEKPGTFKCARLRCKTCSFVQNADKISGPKRSVKITDRFTCTSANVIYCITCTLCKKLYIGETGRRLGDRFREHLRDIEKDDKDASKPVAQHFNLPNHSKEHMSICGLSLQQGTTDSRKNLEQRFSFQIGTLNPHGINECFSFN